MRNNRIKYFISNLLLVVLLIIFARFLLSERSELVRLKEVPASVIATLVVLNVLFLFNSAFSVKVLMKAFGHDLPFKEWFGLSCITGMCSFFMPAKTGVMPRAFYMKKKYGFQLTKFFTSYLGYYIVTFITNSLTSLIAVYSIYRRDGVFHEGLFFFFLAVMICSIIFILFVRVVKRFNFKSNTINMVVNGLEYFKKQKRLLVKLLILNFISTVIFALKLLVSFRSVGVNVDFFTAFIVSGTIFLSLVLSLTPANLGVKELLITGVASLLGYTGISGALVSIIDRGIYFVVVMFFGAIFSFILFHRLIPKTEMENES